MAIYIIFIMTNLILLSIPFRSNNNIYYPLSFISYILILSFSGFRYGIGTDYFNYESIFYNIHYDNSYNSGLEYGFYYLSKLLPQEKEGFFSLIFITSLITNFTLFLAIKNRIKNKSPEERFLIILFFFISNLYFLPFNGIRQGIAFSCTLLSFTFIKQRHFLYFLILILIGSLFHKSILLFIPFYFVYKINIKNLYCFIIVSISFILVKSGIFSLTINSLINILGEKYARYLENPVDYGGSGLGVYLYVILFLFIYFIKFVVRNEKMKTKEYNFLFLMFSIGISFRILALDNIIFVRPSYYFTVFDTFFIPFFIMCFNKNKFIISIVITCFYLISFLASLSNSNGLLPYQNIFIS